MIFQHVPAGQIAAARNRGCQTGVILHEQLAARGNGGRQMNLANYKVVPNRGGWGIDHDGKVIGRYATKEAAFEAAVGPASNAIKEGYEVRITVEGSRENEPALGKS
jgi:hypothetical protein